MMWGRVGDGNCGRKLTLNSDSREAGLEIMNASGRAPDTISFCLCAQGGEMRLDQSLAQVLPQFSRARLQQWIREGRVRVDDSVLRPRDSVRGGETVLLQVPQAESGEWQAEAIPLDVVYEDEDLLVINKPADIVVHPGAGNPDGTLLNALLHHTPSLASLPRAGIVHRLDKETSGLMVVAKNEASRLNLIDQLSRRSLKREYLAVLAGVPVAGGTVDAAIGRHPRERTRMAISPRGKPAVSHFRVVRRFRQHALVRVQLESGRTHQIRVHMAHIGFPVFGDPVYGGRLRIPRDSDETLIAVLRGFRRQALHAARLGLIHPRTGQEMEWEASVPADMQNLIDQLERDQRDHADTSAGGRQ
jgi:23S rRNA pseudouridine1911/1915/1917 synthase